MLHAHVPITLKMINHHEFTCETANFCVHIWSEQWTTKTRARVHSQHNSQYILMQFETKPSHLAFIIKFSVQYKCTMLRFQPPDDPFNCYYFLITKRWWFKRHTERQNNKKWRKKKWRRKCKEQIIVQTETQLERGIIHLYHVETVPANWLSHAWPSSRKEDAAIASPGLQSPFPFSAWMCNVRLCVGNGLLLLTTIIVVVLFHILVCVQRSSLFFGN